MNEFVNTNLSSLSWTQIIANTFKMAFLALFFTTSNWASNKTNLTLLL